MVCKNCNSPLSEGTAFCGVCGTPVEYQQQQQPQYTYDTSYVNPTPKIITEEDLPEQYRPLGAWSYFWLQILYAIPIIGFIFLIIFSFNSGNINRRSFTRSYWCFFLIVGVLLGIIALFTFGFVGAVRL